MTFQMERKKYDYARAEFDYSVGEQMKEHTHEKGGQLRTPQPVEVCLGGEVIKILYFKPDYVTYGDHGTYIKFHDLQESMDSGVVDTQWERVELKKAYKHAFEKRTNNLINEIKFAIPDDIETELVGQSIFAVDQLVDTRVKEVDSIRDEVLSITKSEEIARIEANSNKKLVDSYYAIDFEQVSPTKAIWKLNEMFNIDTWVDKNRTLWVGTPEALGRGHLAAPNDNRVWRYNGDKVNIRHAREPIFAVIVEGRWIDENGIGTPEDVINWFDTSDDNSQGFGDYRAEGVALRPNVNPDEGRIIKRKDTKAKKDALDEVALKYLREASKDQNSGSVQLIPELSGEEISKFSELRVGDALRLVPNDKWFDNPSASSGQLGDRPDRRFNCGSFIYNEVYHVQGVTHDVTQGDWKVNVYLGMFPDFEAKKYLRFFDPRSGEVVSEEDVYPKIENGNPIIETTGETEDEYGLSGGS